MEGWDMVCQLGVSKLDHSGRKTTARALEGRMVRFLSSFTRQPTALRSAMRRTNTVLSGGACLAFLQPSPSWSPTDLDFYCPDQGYEQFCHFLIEELGGRTELSHGAFDDDNPYSAKQLGFSHRRVIKTQEATFDVMRSIHATPFTPIAKFDNTLLMNYLSADELCIAYPWTFDDRVGIMSSHGVSDTRRKLYVDRGYRLLDSSLAYWGEQYESVCTPHGHCARALRCFGDKHSLRLKFQQEIIVGSDISPPIPDLSTVWVFGGAPCGNSTCNQRVERYSQTVRNVRRGEY